MPNDGSFALNNYLQGKGRLTSLSWQDSTTGPRNAPQWTSVCKIDGQVLGTGTGAQKHVARDMAANEALKALIEADG